MNQAMWRVFCLYTLLVLSVPLQASQPLDIYTVNYPLAYFAERIAGDQAKVVFPAPADVDPAFWQPDLETIRAYQQADLILLNGAGYAKWVARTSLPMLRTVNTSRVFSDQLIHSTASFSHSHGSGDTHNHAGTAFTTWLDMSLAIKQANAIAEALKRKRPEQSALFDKNLHDLEEDLLQLDQQIKDVIAMQPMLPLLASHPVYQYLARKYQLNLQYVMWEPEQVPDTAQWQLLNNMLATHKANRMLWEARPNLKTVARLRGLGIISLVYFPLANRPDRGDFISVMQGNLKNLRVVFDYL